MIFDYGILPVIKPCNISSNAFLNNFKKKFKEKNIKIGHSGTLDPFASGVLILLLGKGCKLNFLFNLFPKEYIAVVKLGEKKDTGDITGKSIGFSDVLKRSEIENNLRFFRGKIKQVPHKFSAVKINGIRAYKLARENIDFKLNEKEITIYENKLISFNEKLGKALIYVKCSSGTYIRKYVEDIAEYSNKYAFCEKLVRLSIGNINLKRIINFSNKFFLDDKNYDINYNFFYPTIELFKDYFYCFKINDFDKSDSDFLINLFKYGKVLYNNKKFELMTKEFLKKDISSLNNNNEMRNYFSAKINSDLILFFNKENILTTVIKVKQNYFEYLFNYPEIITF